MHVFQTQVCTPNSEARLARQIKASKLESAWRGADSGGCLPAWQMCLMYVGGEGEFVDTAQHWTRLGYKH